MRRSLFAFLALLAAAPVAAQQAQPAQAQGVNTYRSPAGFVLDLPAEWTRAPASTVEEVSSAAATPGLTYEAVFEAGGAGSLAAIARGAAPRSLTLAEFRRRWTTGEAQAKMQGLATGADTVRGMRVGLRVGVPWWDEANRASWIRADVQATGGFAWTVLMLHPSGGWLIMLQYYAEAGENEEQVLAQLDEVIRSLRVD